MHKIRRATFIQLYLQNNLKSFWDKKLNSIIIMKYNLIHVSLNSNYVILI